MEEMEERTIVLLGKTGVGKSSTGNTILRMNRFKSRQSVDSVTRKCEDQQAVIDGKLVRVVDTPGFFDTEISEHELAKELCRSVYLSHPGVHAFVFILPYGRITEQEEEMIGRIKKVLGKNVTNHMILVFTHGDEVKDGGEDLNRCRNKYIRNVLSQCGGRYQIFNNKNPDSNTDRTQVTDLLEKIDEMVMQNVGRIYTSVAYEEAKRYAWEKYWEKYGSVFYDVVSQLTRNAPKIFIGVTLLYILITLVNPIITALSVGCAIGTLAYGFIKVKAQ